MSLHVLAYNIKRVIAIIGVGPLLQAIRAWVPRSARRPCRNLTAEVSPPSSANAFFHGLGGKRSFGRDGFPGRNAPKAAIPKAAVRYERI